MNELVSSIRKLSDRFKSFEKPLDLPNKKVLLEKLEKQSQDPDLWSNNEKARRLMQELDFVKKEIEEVANLDQEIKALVELSEQGELNEEILADVERLEKDLHKLELTTYLSSKYDKKNAIVSIHSGQGGVEAMDWASMLFRMYMRFCEKRNWKFDMIDENRGEDTGIKSVTFKVSGMYAYGYLKNESGTHRLVRQSPFNSDNLRQTSFALVEVMPELEETDLLDIEIREEDLDWQFFRASGQGGQNVQKVSTAVRVKHIPTGLTVTAQTERYQEQNRKNALALLRAKLWSIEQERQAKERQDIQGEYTPATWGTQIRSYVLHPYKMIKDLRTEVETSDAEGVLDGNLDEFVEAELKLGYAS